MVKSTTAKERKQAWISQKTATIMKDGVKGNPVKDSKQAYAIAVSMYRNRKRKGYTAKGLVNPESNKEVSKEEAKKAKRKGSDLKSLHEREEQRAYYHYILGGGK